MSGVFFTIISVPSSMPQTESSGDMDTILKFWKGCPGVYREHTCSTGPREANCIQQGQGRKDEIHVERSPLRNILKFRAVSRWNEPPRKILNCPFLKMITCPGVEGIHPEGCGLDALSGPFQSLRFFGTNFNSRPNQCL